MNRYFIFSIFILSLLNGCICNSGCDFYQLDSFHMIKQDRNYRTSSRVTIPFQFYYQKYESEHGGSFCIGYTKEECLGTASDQIIKDSTILLCNKPLMQNTSVYSANTNLLSYGNLNQYLFMPENFYSEFTGSYQINLNYLDFKNADLSSPYIFTLKVKTDKSIYSDTIHLTLQP